MAGELVSFGVEKLWDLLSDEYELLKGVEDQVTELRSDLNLLKSFLEDADTKKHENALVRYCVEEIKEIVCDAEDAIEEFILKEKLRKGTGIEKRIRRVACFIQERREIASYIGGVSKRIARVIKDMQTFNVQPKIDYGSTRPLHGKEGGMRQTYHTGNEGDFMGLDANIKKAVELLVKNDNVQVVTITGMGGVGKTTLARKVFEHKNVKGYFSRFAWVRVSPDLNLKKVWKKIFMDLKSNEEDKKIMEMTESTLQGELFRLLGTSKSFIVLDDIRKEDWDLIEPIFPPNKAWKVLLTSRNNIVDIPGDTKYANLELEGLTEDESWTLFERVAFAKIDSSGSVIDDEMKEKIRNILNDHCKRRPWAIEVFGGLLAAKSSLEDWKEVFKNIQSHKMGKTIFIDDDNGSIYHVLSVSFEDMPSYLKRCFLYLAHFREDHEINVDILSYYWFAEGIFEASHYSEKTTRDVADDCIEELVTRNMVMARRDVLTSKYETCRLHQMMRKICLLKAQEENFLQILPSPRSNVRSPCRSRRLVCQNPTALHIESDINYSKLRSLLFVDDDIGTGWELSGTSFRRLKLLRVLDLFHTRFNERKLASSIGKLIHLRYLNLKDVILSHSHLPSSLENLTLLIYLNLKVAARSPIFVPNVFTGMQDLRYLILPRSMHKKTKLDLSNQVNLEALKRFSTKTCKVKNLRRMIRLRTLSIYLTDEKSTDTLSASIGELEHLEYLSIKDCRRKKKNEEGIVLDINIKRLKLSIYMPRLLKEQHLPSRLTNLCLHKCRLEDDPMPVLEKLPQLKAVTLQEGSFCGKKMVCSAGRFPQLQKLSLLGLDEWQEWIVEKGSMPLLHTLTIIDCPKLKELPYIDSLTDLTLSREWNERLSEGGEDYYKIKDIPSVKFVWAIHAHYINF